MIHSWATTEGGRMQGGTHLLFDAHLDVGGGMGLGGRASINSYQGHLPGYAEFLRLSLRSQRHSLTQPQVQLPPLRRNLCVWVTRFDRGLEVATLRARCEDGELGDAAEALDSLIQRGYHIDHSLFYRFLKRCTSQKDLVLGRRVHALAVKCGYRSNAFLANHIIGMYASHGRLEESMQVFSMVGMPNAYMWASIILAHARNGQSTKAIQLYWEMRKSMVIPDNHIFVAVLKACARAADLSAGREVHGDILQSSVELDLFVGNALVDMYSKCGSLEDARRVFDGLPTRDIVTWNAMMAGYAQKGLGQEALALYVAMQQEGMTPFHPITFVCLLQACASVGDVRQGKELHVQIQDRGLENDLFVGNSLVNMYAKCGRLEDAQIIFDRLPTRDVVTWTAMIAGYARQGMGQEALKLYASMQKEGITRANNVTFVCLLQACASVGALHEGKRLHAQIKERGLETDVVVGNGLVDMYAKCGSLEESRQVFDILPTRNVVTWNAMFTGYVHHGLGQEALALYASMQLENLNPANHVTYVCLLQACASVGALHQGKQLHAHIQQKGLEADPAVSNCLVDMYAKCGRLEDARRVFTRVPIKDVVTWTVMLNGYVENSHAQMAMQCFEAMLEEGVEPDATTFSCLLVACSQAGLVHEAQQYFKLMVHHGILPTDYHYNCMVDLLGRAGRFNEAEGWLQSVPLESRVLGWTSLLSTCKSQSDSERGRQYFDHLIKLDPTSASPYVLLGNMYANTGRWMDACKVESMRLSAGAWKKPAKACIEVRDKVHEFIVGDERTDVSAKSRSINVRLKEEGGHEPRTELVMKPVSVEEKQDALCGHAEKLALAYGLLNTADSTPLLVTKNLRMCTDCHSATKVLSRLEMRDIVVRDSNRVHCFVDGSCSCEGTH